MAAQSADFDAALAGLLVDWRGKLGPPTCHAGCSRCCRTTSVMVSAPELLRLQDGLAEFPAAQVAAWRAAWQARFQSLREQLFPGISEPEALSALLSGGACVFLLDDRCGIYPCRPDTCRSVYVWHEAEKCGRPDFDMCTPAELLALRTRQMYALLDAEIERDRIPFWGHLLVMLGVMAAHRQEYEDGIDLSRVIDPVWAACGLLRFFEPGETPALIASTIEQERMEYEELFRIQAWPLGQPRASEAGSRDELQAFPITTDW